MNYNDAVNWVTGGGYIFRPEAPTWPTNKCVTATSTGLWLWLGSDMQGSYVPTSQDGSAADWITSNTHGDKPPRTQ